MAKALLLFFILCLHNINLAQTSFIKKFNWSDAGFKGLKPTYSQTVNILNYGGNNTNSASNNSALLTAISALAGKGGVVYFPMGVYSFTGQISITRDSITFKGAGSDSTQLRFNLSGTANNCINIIGSQITSDSASFSSAGMRDSNWVNVLNASVYQAGQWVYLQNNDNAYMHDTWAYGSLGQVMQIKSISGNKITFNSPFRYYYKLSLQPKITKLNPKQAIGFECMKIQRLDPTTNQTSIFNFDKVVQSWVHGVESDSTNFAHIELNRCSNIDITNSYFHHAFNYGGGGKAYGVALQYSANECKIENNIFQNLRHSILFQSGANGNVCGYNYSFNPFWSQFPLPANSAGDIVFHGNFPFANLCEGNINQNTVIDNAHLINGPYNTLFRNRSELYGVVMNNNPASDTVQFLGLEVTNSTNGQYLLYGNGHVQVANNINGVITPSGSNTLPEVSLYYSGSQKPICFNPGNNNWPLIGLPNTFNTGSNSAKDRVMQGVFATCACTATFTTNNLKSNSHKASENYIFPNPATNTLKIKNLSNVLEVSIYTVESRLILNEQAKNITEIDISSFANGIYLIGIRDKNGIRTSKFIKE